MAFCPDCGKEVEELGALCEDCSKKEEPQQGESADTATPPLIVIRKTAERRDMILAALLIIPSLLLINSLFWGGAGLGLTIGSLLIAVISFAYAIYEKRRLPSVYSVVLMLLFLISSLSLTFSDESISKGFSVVMLLLLYMVILTDYFNNRARKAGSYRAIADILETVFVYGIGKLSDGVFALFRKKDDEGNITKRQTGKVFTGILVAVPVLFVVIPLLISSDAAFEGIFKSFSIDDVGELIVTLFFGALYFLAVFSRLFTMKETPKLDERKSEIRGLEPISVISFLSALSLAYVVYLFSQLAYFFSAFSGLLPEDFTVAEYARRGFFEMCAVCAINLFIVFLTSVLCRKKETGLPIAVKILNLFLCVFSLILIGTALSKMVLYINSYGMTRLRIFTSLFMVLLACILITVILKLFIHRIPYMKIILVIACALLVGSCLADTDRVIANYNVNAYLSGKLDTMDVAALELLDDAAIEPLLKLYREDDGEAGKQARIELCRRLKEHYDVVLNENDEWCLRDKNPDIRSLNLTEYSAKKLLRESWTEFHFFDNRGDELNYH